MKIEFFAWSLGLLILSSTSGSLGGEAFDGSSLNPEISATCGGQPKPLVNVEGLVENNCGQRNISVFAKDEAAVHMACAGIGRAVKFFSNLGMRTEKPIEIIISEEISPYRVAQGFSWKTVHGFVDTRDLRIYMGPRELIGKSAGLMSLPYSDEFYVSYIAHEASHILAQHFYGHQCKLMPGEQQEFIAYFSQLSTIDKNLREEILQRFKEKKWDRFQGLDEINPAYHGMNPHGFAVKSYLYGITPEGNQAFRDFLAGKIEPIPPPTNY